MDVIIFHNPACGTSRNSLALIRATGTKPRIVHYLDTPPTREELVSLVEKMGISPHDLLRKMESRYADLGLDEPGLSDDALIDAMAANPILINRPIVVGPRGTKLCRPSEVVLTILDNPLTADFVKEDGEVVPLNG